MYDELYRTTRQVCLFDDLQIIRVTGLIAAGDHHGMGNSGSRRRTDRFHRPLYRRLCRGCVQRHLH